MSTQNNVFTRVAAAFGAVALTLTLFAGYFAVPASNASAMLIV